ncbi:MAG: hypothetical protein P8Y37_12955, partial [Anaerolineales bacterium]
NADKTVFVTLGSPKLNSEHKSIRKGLTVVCSNSGGNPSTFLGIQKTGPSFGRIPATGTGFLLIVLTNPSENSGGLAALISPGQNDRDS